jgi:hypothetical protein
MTHPLSRFAGGLLACAMLSSMPPAPTTAQTPRAEIWLDRPLANWNTAGAPVPTAPAANEPTAAVIRRCALKPPRTTAGERAVESAGWIPFWNVDHQLVRHDVEIVGGMGAADGMCRPLAYNLFVFVAGRFAGTLSPTPMDSRLDGSAGVVRAAPPLIAADFARYASGDALCCPWSRVTVRYGVERAPTGPLVIPQDIRTTRP